MPINQISTSNTFQQWLISTQQLISRYNFYEQDFNLISEHEEKINDLYAYLIYVPPSIGFFKVNGSTDLILETGSILENPVFTWSLSGASPSFLNISNVGTVNPEATSYTYSGTYSTNVDWVLTAIATNPIEQDIYVRKTATLRFKDKVYWGTSADLIITEQELLEKFSAFESGLQKTITYNATGGRYPYYAYPDRFGAINEVYVNGFYFSDYTESKLTITNSSGASSLYRIVRFDTLQHGSSIEVTWS